VTKACEKYGAITRVICVFQVSSLDNEATENEEMKSGSKAEENVEELSDEAEDKERGQGTQKKMATYKL